MHFVTHLVNEIHHLSSSKIQNFSIIGTLVISLSGCTLNSQVADLESEQSLVTGAIAEQVKPEGIDEQDAELIKQAVIAPNETENGSNLLAWNNPETGNKGTITAIDDFVGKHGQSCKKFRTTVDSFMGISLYNGETCELRKGFWVLSWFIRDLAK